MLHAEMSTIPLEGGRRMSMPSTSTKTYHATPRKTSKCMNAFMDIVENDDLLLHTKPFAKALKGVAAAFFLTIVTSSTDDQIAGEVFLERRGLRFMYEFMSTGKSGSKKEFIQEFFRWYLAYSGRAKGNSTAQQARDAIILARENKTTTRLGQIRGREWGGGDENVVVFSSLSPEELAQPPVPLAPGSSLCSVVGVTDVSTKAAIKVYNERVNNSFELPRSFFDVSTGKFDRKMGSVIRRNLNSPFMNTVLEQFNQTTAGRNFERVQATLGKRPASGRDSRSSSAEA